MALLSPPKVAPLFNRTFRAISSGEVWTARDILGFTFAHRCVGNVLLGHPVLKAPLVGEDRGAGENYILASNAYNWRQHFPSHDFLWTYFTSIYDAEIAVRFV